MRAAELRGAVRERLIPAIEALGFRASGRRERGFSAFRRDAGPCVHVLEIQWDARNRPRFAINYGTCPKQGLDIAGRHFHSDEVCAGWLADSGRLLPHRGSASWFRQDSGPLRNLFLRLTRHTPPTPETLVEQALALLPELERYWTSGERGPHQHPCPPAPLAPHA